MEKVKGSDYLKLCNPNSIKKLFNLSQLRHENDPKLKYNGMIYK